MVKKVGFKLSICFAFVLLILTSFKGIDTAYASETKYVTESFIQDYYTTEYDFNNRVMNTLNSSTYNYNVGGFKGTLICTNVVVMSQTLQYNNYYHYTVKVFYYGHVSNGNVKDISIIQTATFQAPEDQLDMIIGSYLHSSYYYDDGTYSGSLYGRAVSVVSKTVYQQTPNYTVYNYTVNVTYTGTVSD